MQEQALPYYIPRPILHRLMKQLQGLPADSLVLLQLLLLMISLHNNSLTSVEPSRIEMHLSKSTPHIDLDFTSIRDVQLDLVR